MEDKKAFVVTPEIFVDVVKKYLDNLKESEYVSQYSVDLKSRSISILFDPDKEIEDSKDDFISMGLFVNVKKVLTDLGYDNVDQHTVMMPIYSVTEDNNRVVINF